MFKSARWRSEKTNKIEALFKLQFHATQVEELNADALMIFIVPADTGKESARLEKAIVKDGCCEWKNPVYETVKFIKELRTGKIKEKLYHFVISTGVSKSCVVGAVSFDFADYANATKAASVSLPIKYSKTRALLNLTLQRVQGNANSTDGEEGEEIKCETRDGSLNSYLNIDNNDGSMKDNSTQFLQDSQFNIPVQSAELNVNGRASSFSGTTNGSSESSCGLDTPRELALRISNLHQEVQDPATLLSYDPNSTMPNKPAANGSIRTDEDRQRPQWDWSEGSDHGLGTDESTNSSQETIPRDTSHRASDDDIDKLKAELVSLARQADLSDLELQTLRKQIVKESKRGQDLAKEVINLKQERDELQGECQKLRASGNHVGDVKAIKNFRSQGDDAQALLEEIREELNHEKELNSNLRLQLQKTQDSNAELLLAIQDLDQMLEQKNREISSFSKKRSGPCEKPDELIDPFSRSETDDDEEQKALEEIVKEHLDTKETYMLEQRIMDLQSEIEVYRRDKEELEMQMEQLALDYEIMKQENHDISHKLEQSQLQEQLKMQYECSSSFGNLHELETQIESLENELKKQSKDLSDSLATIKDLETHIESLEEELEKQAQGFEADLEAVTHAKVEQEQRAIRAEEALRMTRQKNVHTAERLQDEFRRLSEQMASTFDANEKVATKALAEASDLRLHNSQLQDMLKQTYEELQSVKDDYETKLHELSNQLLLKTKKIKQISEENLDKSKHFEQQKRRMEEVRVAHSQETLKLKAEIERLKIDNNVLAKQGEQRENLESNFEQMKTSIKETEGALQKRIMERNDLVTAVVLLKKESDKLVDEFNRIKCLKDEKERAVNLLQSQLETLEIESKGLRHSLVEDELEKGKLVKQVVQLKDDLKKKGDAVSSLEKKLKESGGRGALSGGTKTAMRNNKSSPPPVGSKEITNLREKIKLLEGQIKSKEASLESSTNAFLEKEKALGHKIEELENRLEELGQSSARLCDEQLQKEAAAGSIQNNSCGGNPEELLNELVAVKEKSKEMEIELKEMQERYSEISLKFAEVEGERQQLVMTVRYLKNAKNKKT